MIIVIMKVYKFSNTVRKVDWLFDNAGYSKYYKNDTSISIRNSWLLDYGSYSKYYKNDTSIFIRNSWLLDNSS